MENIDKHKLILDYEKAIERLYKAENWAINNNFNWDDVGVFDSLLKYTNNQNVIDAYNNREN